MTKELSSRKGSDDFSSGIGFFGLSGSGLVFRRSWILIFGFSDVG